MSCTTPRWSKLTASTVRSTTRGRVVGVVLDRALHVVPGRIGAARRSTTAGRGFPRPSRCRRTRAGSGRCPRPAEHSRGPAPSARRPRRGSRRGSAQPRHSAATFGRMSPLWPHRIPLLPYSRHGLNSRNLGQAQRAAGLEGRTMPELIPHAPDNPEFARVIELAADPRPRRRSTSTSPRPRPRPQALARLLGAPAVRKLRFAGRADAAAGRRLAARRPARRDGGPDLRGHASIR